MQKRELSIAQVLENIKQMMHKFKQLILNQCHDSGENYTLWSDVSFLCTKANNSFNSSY